MYAELARNAEELFDALIQLNADTPRSRASSRDLAISDPPYLGGFDAYTATRFSRAQHEELAATLERLAANGCLVLAFNSPAAEPLYSGCAHLEWAYRSGRINCRADARDRVREFVAYASRSGVAARA